MTFEERGNMSGKTLMLLPGTCCDWQMNFSTVIDALAEKYHLILVNYDGFDGSDLIFPDMITVTEKIEKYIIDNHNGRLVHHWEAALLASLYSVRTFTWIMVSLVVLTLIRAVSCLQN